MPDGLSLVGNLARTSVRVLAIKTAAAIDGCSPVRVPDRPLMLRHLSDRAIAGWRGEKLGEENRELFAVWDEWNNARSFATNENERRLRQALWCYRALRELGDKDEREVEARSYAELVRAFLAEEWGVHEPPLDRVECNTLAQRIARSKSELDP